MRRLTWMMMLTLCGCGTSGPYSKTSYLKPGTVAEAVYTDMGNPKIDNKEGKIVFSVDAALSHVAPGTRISVVEDSPEPDPGADKRMKDFWINRAVTAKVETGEHAGKTGFIPRQYLRPLK